MCAANMHAGVCICKLTYMASSTCKYVSPPMTWLIHLAGFASDVIAAQHRRRGRHQRLFLRHRKLTTRIPAAPKWVTTSHGITRHQADTPVDAASS